MKAFKVITAKNIRSFATLAKAEAAVAKLVAEGTEGSLRVPGQEDVKFGPVATPAVKTCKKDASHGEHRVTKSGSYCYACDRIAAEAQKAARAAAKATVAAAEAHANKGTSSLSSLLP